MSNVQRWHKDLVDGVVYNYWKEKDRLVVANYAKKVWGVGDTGFQKIIEHFNIEPVIRKSPSIHFQTKLYSLSRIYEVKNLFTLKGNRVEFLPVAQA